MEHLCRLVDYAVAMRLRLEDVNIHSFNNFDLKVGISCGPLVGGVIGARKPVFDIWGNTVNLASRMDSTGVMGKIQVPEEIARVSLRNCRIRVVEGASGFNGGTLSEYSMELVDTPEEPLRIVRYFCRSSTFSQILLKVLNILSDALESPQRPLRYS